MLSNTNNSSALATRMVKLPAAITGVGRQRRIVPFVESKDLGPKPWGQELLLAHTESYTLKKLVYEAGHQGALQYHERKDEAFHLHSGAALVTWMDAEGTKHGEYMEPGQTFHVPPGTPHKFHALSQCVVYEASTPVFNDRVNVAEKYADEDGQAR